MLEFVYELSYSFVLVNWCKIFSATCDDGIKNQGEIGVDCGGPCTTECPGMRNRDIL